MLFIKVYRTLEKVSFNLISAGARIPVYLMTIGFDLRAYAAKGFLLSAGDAARR
jgi:hypothetical protein